jgi:hypothetical protein
MLGLKQIAFDPASRLRVLLQAHKSRSRIAGGIYFVLCESPAKSLGFSLPAVRRIPNSLPGCVIVANCQRHQLVKRDLLGPVCRKQSGRNIRQFEPLTQDGRSDSESRGDLLRATALINQGAECDSTRR